jgi:hypothetical protein
MRGPNLKGLAEMEGGRRKEEGEMAHLRQWLHGSVPSNLPSLANQQLHRPLMSTVLP